MNVFLWSVSGSAFFLGGGVEISNDNGLSEVSKINFLLPEKKENVFLNTGSKSVPKEKSQAFKREVCKAALKSCRLHLYVFYSTGV